RERSTASPTSRTADAAPAVDPKDAFQIVETFRAAEDAAAARKWTQAIRLLQSIIRDDAGIADVWNRLAVCAMRIERYEQAAQAPPPRIGDRSVGPERISSRRGCSPRAAPAGRGE